MGKGRACGSLPCGERTSLPKSAVWRRQGPLTANALGPDMLRCATGGTNCVRRCESRPVLFNSTYFIRFTYCPANSLVGRLATYMCLPHSDLFTCCSTYSQLLCFLIRMTRRINIRSYMPLHRRRSNSEPSSLLSAAVLSLETTRNQSGLAHHISSQPF